VLRAAALPAKIAIGFAAMNARLIPLWAAKEEGFFAKNDIYDEPIFVSGAPTLNAAMLSGDLNGTCPHFYAAMCSGLTQPDLL
jgi:ABC-type nitrate/sulfonate/bicarbonate transport system substrate-binding protein